ncbi:MAG: sugar phosphate isomerase/epimerase [Clostridiales bacterium]|jgi:sugar phosphate isomerase/epimerase|nr:sugar phosphate isomerase/epimerase [Clostridiales bacterium]
MGKLPVGLQVYGVRDLLAKSPQNFESVMESVKGIGYDYVELAGLHGLEPERVAEVLQKVGLKAISAHVPVVDMIASAEKVAKDYKLIGCDYVVVPYLPPEFRHLTPGYDTVIAEIKKIGQVMNENGLTLLYHNHDFEFVKLPDGRFGFDDIYEQVSPELLKVEPDTCWIKVAGQDPVSYILKYANRCEIVHLKDFIKRGDPRNLYKLIGLDEGEKSKEEGFFEFRPVGFGQQLWEPILDASLKAGAKYVVVEQDEHYGIGSLEAARRSREYLKILGW